MPVNMKRLAALLAALTVFFCAYSAVAVSPSDYDMTQPQALTAEHLYGESALVVDMDTGEILFSKNSRIRMYPASTTKIMTLLIGIEQGPTLDTIVTLPAETSQIASGSSVIPVKPGDQMTYRDLLYGFMLSSGNDGANAIAVLTSGSIDAFVSKMNKKAAELGCEGTHFMNAHGLHDENHYTTAQDLALIARCAMQNETFADIVKQPSYKMTILRNGETRELTVANRNSLVVPDQKYYYAECTGVKTGHTGKAGYCFVGSAQRGDMRVVSVTLNCPQDENKWYDTAKLFEYGFTCYSPLVIDQLFARAQEQIATVQIKNAAETDIYGGSLALNLSEISNPTYYRMVRTGSEASIDYVVSDFIENAEVTISDDLVAPVSQGEVIGSLTYTARTGEVLTANLTASRSIEKQPDPTPEPTREPVVQTPSIKNSSGNDGLIIIAMLLLIGVLLLAILLGIVNNAKKKRRRREMEARRRAAMRRRQAQRGKNGVYSQRSNGYERNRAKKGDGNWL